MLFVLVSTNHESRLQVSSSFFSLSSLQSNISFNTLTYSSPILRWTFLLIIRSSRCPLGVAVRRSSHFRLPLHSDTSRFFTFSELSQDHFFNWIPLHVRKHDQFIGYCRRAARTSDFFNDPTISCVEQPAKVDAIELETLTLRQLALTRSNKIKNPNIPGRSAHNIFPSYGTPIPFKLVPAS